MNDPMWRDRAACLDADPELFFPNSNHDTTAVALAYCNRCPVVAECREFARSNAREGIWGGENLSDPQLRKGLSVCVDCNHLTRKPGTSITEFPATRTWKTLDLCSTCYHRRQREAAAA